MRGPGHETRGCHRAARFANAEGESTAQKHEGTKMRPEVLVYGLGVQIKIHDKEGIGLA